MPQAQPRPKPLPGPPLAGETHTLLRTARGFAAQNKSDDAFAAYLALLRQVPSHLEALHELGCLAHLDGYRSAARTVYEQLVQHWPQDGIGRVNLGNLLYEEGELDGAQAQFEVALAIEATLCDAHRGLGRIAFDRGESEIAGRHWRQSFPGQAAVTQLYRGSGQETPLLLLVSAGSGNIPTKHILDDRMFAVTVLYADYYRPDLPLPSHALVFNAIGDAELCPAALAAARAIVARSGKPVINHPARVRETARAANALRLSGLPGIRAPWIKCLPRAALTEAPDLSFPMLLRSPGFHTGQHFLRVESRDGLDQAVADLPGDELLAIEFLDARGPDGLARKYRVMCIGGQFYPLHLAISADWKVHYFSADMLASDVHRAEERRFLEDMPGVIGPRAMVALEQITVALGLDYAGIDFGLGADGSLLLFEANATMLIHPPAADAIWDYRRQPALRALTAARQLLAQAAR
jgi:hypothetical protein